MTRRSLVILIVVAMVVGSVGFAVGALVAGPDDSSSAERSNWLFTQTAEAGSISPNSDGTWALTLSGVDPTVMAFTDRPLREAQAGSVERLVEAWPEMFSESNPNGVVVAHNEEGETNSAVVELMDPQLDGSTMTYTVRVLANEGRAAEPGVTYDFSKVSVFIDDVGVTSWVCEAFNGAGVVDPPGVLPAPLAPNVWRTECEVNGGIPVPQSG